MFLYAFFYFRAMFASTLQLYKKAYTGLSQNTWYLSLVMLINRSGTMVVPFMTMYCTLQLGFTILQAGFIMTLFGAGAITGALIGGRITDRIGFYPMQVASLFLGGIMFLVTGYIKTYPLLCISTFVLSLCNESFRPANSAAIAHYSKPENRTRSYSLNRLAVNLGWAVGGTLGGFFASINYHLLFWVDGLTNIFAAFLLLRLLPPVKSVAKQELQPTTPVKYGAYKDRPYLLFIFLTIFFASCFFQLFTLQPLFFKKDWHLTEQTIGLLMALNGIIIVVIEMIMVYSLEGTRPLMSFISAGVLLVGIGYSLTNIFPSYILSAFLLVTIITFGEILSMPFMNSFWVSRTNEGNRGQYAAIYTIAWSAAQIIAPSLGSAIIEQSGFASLWWIDGVVCAVAAYGFWLLGGYLKKNIDAV